MRDAKLYVHRNFLVGRADRDMFGFFMECGEGEIQRGIYYPDPDRPGTEENGFRRDMMEWFREMEPGVIRGPGGNNMATFRWKDSIGPRKERPVTVNYAHSEPGQPNLDSNQAGIDDLLTLTELLGCDCMLCVNLCDNTLQDVMEEMEYCLLPGGTYWSERRRQNGYRRPHRVGYWYLGNEVDGNWIYGQHTPDSYGHKAREAAKMMKTLCPEARVVLCGSSNPYVATYPDWNRQVLGWAFDYVDLLSIHYIRNCDPAPGADTREQPVGARDLGQLGVELEDMIRTTAASIQVVQAQRHSRKRIGISLDEWGEMGLPADVPQELGWTEQASFSQEETRRLMDSGLPWYFARPNTLLVAVAYGMYLTAFLNHADVLDVVCKCFVDRSLLLPTQEGLLKLAACYPFEMVSKYGRGMVMRQNLEGVVYQTQRYGEVPALWTASVYQEEQGTVTIFAANVDPEEEIRLSVEVDGFARAELFSHVRLWDPQPLCGNTFREPERVVPREIPLEEHQDGILLPPISWTMLRFRAVGESRNRSENRLEETAIL